MNRWTRPVTLPRWNWLAYAAAFWILAAHQALSLIGRIIP